MSYGEMSPADYAAVTNGACNGFGNGEGWWIILLLLFAGGGFGNGFGGNGGTLPYLWNQQTQNDVNRGFDTAGLQNQLTGIQGAVTNGFASAEVANCGRAMDAMQTAYGNQIASMNQRFADVTAIGNRLDDIGMSLQNCCCENRANIADLKYTVATEACADRAAVNDALRDVIAANTASTQRILDQMCQDKIDAKNEKIAELQTQLNMANLVSSQTAQTARLLADNAAQTNALEQYLAPVPRPAYVVQNPNCCAQNFGCGF